MRQLFAHGSVTARAGLPGISGGAGGQGRGAPVTHRFLLGRLEHGGDAEITWVNEMAVVISNRLANTSMSDWQVAAYSWEPWSHGLPPSVLDNAITIGRKQIGPQIVQQGWQHVHMIAHSAGSGLI